MPNFGTHKSSAKVVDGKLILSFPGALKPTVWQMDFGQVKASALEVSEKDGEYVLSLKTPKGENMDIAPFEKREQAVDGLLAASKALESAQGKIRPGAGNDAASFSTAAPSGTKKKWVAPFLAVLLLFILLSVWSSLAPIEPSSISQNGGVSGGASPASSTGVPMSADDFLRAQ